MNRGRVRAASVIDRWRIVRTRCCVPLKPAIPVKSRSLFETRRIPDAHPRRDTETQHTERIKCHEAVKLSHWKMPNECC